MFDQGIATRFAAACAALLMMLSAADVFAWSSVAAWNGRYSYIASNFASAEQARNAALQGCEKAVMGRCETLGDAVTQTATVIVRDVNNQELYTVSSPDPLEAVKRAMTSCRLRFRECVVTDAVWDGGPTWWATASAADSWHIIMGSQSEQDATRDAIRGCEERASQKGSCKVEDAGHGRGYAAIAKSDTSSGVGFGDSKAEAEKGALKQCADVGCKITMSDLNPGLVAAPAALKQVKKMAADGIARMRKLGRWIN